MTRTVRAGAAALLLLLLVAGCAKSEPPPVGVSGDDLPVEGTVKLQVELPDEEGAPTPTDLAYKTELTTPIALVMTATGYTVVPAGTEQVRSGHFHLHWTALDPEEDASKADSICTPIGDTIGQGDGIQHFGDGSTEATLELDPGVYRLCLQLGDAAHTALDPRQEYTIVVTGAADDADDADADESADQQDATTTTSGDGTTTTTAG